MEEQEREMGEERQRKQERGRVEMLLMMIGNNIGRVLQCIIAPSHSHECFAPDHDGAKLLSTDISIAIAEGAVARDGVEVGFGDVHAWLDFLYVRACVHVCSCACVRACVRAVL